MAVLPEGPVTIMFTDLVDSTTIRTRLGDREADALFAVHGELIRERIAAHQGHDQAAALGDGFLAVFPSTRRAVSCAIDIQSALDESNRTRPGPPLKVRIGLNTGEVAWHDEQLSGEAVHAAARVCAAAVGGQILVSDVTRQLAGTVPDVTFRDAGEFDLKGFPTSWRLWEVVYVRATSTTTGEVFVGRDAELARLRTRLHAALEGRGGLVLLGGEPGVGKTTLVRHLIREAEACGALALFGRCYEAGGSIPYVPFVEMLEQALALMPPDIVREDLGEDAPEVARMVPQLRRRFPDIGDPLELPPEQQRRYFFNAVGSFVARGSNRFPLLLVLDDVQWADEPTLLLTEHMAELLPGLRVLAVGTYRDVELDVSRPLATTLERLLRARLVERIAVRRFDRATVAAMIEAMAGRPAPDVVVDAIVGETEGNPFFVEEVYRHLVEDGRLFDAAGDFRTDIVVDELDVPESVRLVVGRRLARLGDSAQRVLAAGAVVGRGFPFRLLEELVDVGAAKLLDVLEAAEAAHVIVAEERDGEVHFSFGHELIRQTLLASLSVVRRQRLHLAVADAIERTDAKAHEDRPAEIANHLVQAGAAADPSRTLAYLERAADRALEAAAFEEALRIVDDAIAVAGSDDAVRMARLLERRGWTLRALGDFDGCIRTWESVIPTYESAGLADDAASLCGEAAYQLIWLARFDEAFAALARGLQIAGDDATSTRVRVLAFTGGMTGLAGFYDAGEEHLQQAETLARALDDERGLGLVLWGRTMSQWSHSRPREAIEAGRGAIAALRRSNDQWFLVDALAWASYPLIASGDPEEVAEGERLATEAVALARKLGHRGGEVLGVRGTGMAATWTADAATYQQIAQGDLDAFAGVASPWVSMSHAMLANTLVLRGELDEAVREARRAMELEVPSAWSGHSWAYALLVHAWRGDHETCRRMLDEAPIAFDDLDEHPPIGAAFAATTAVNACAVIGFRSDAAGMYPFLRRLPDTASVNGFDLCVPQRAAAMAAAAAGEWDEAARLFDVARRRVASFPSSVEAAQIASWHGEMLLDRGRPGDGERARELLTEAHAAFVRLGMPLHAGRCAQRLDGG